MHKQALIVFIILFLGGAFLIGNGITGLYIMDFKQPPCDDNTDCTGLNDVCCKFYNEDFGVCDRQDKCEAISRVTFDARRKISTTDFVDNKPIAPMGLVSSHIEGPSKPGFFYSILVGSFLILLAIAGFFIGKVHDIHHGRSRSLYRHQR